MFGTPCLLAECIHVLFQIFIVIKTVYVVYMLYIMRQ